MPYFEYKNRPKAIQDAINKLFLDISTPMSKQDLELHLLKSLSDEEYAQLNKYRPWSLHNGNSASYQILGIDEYKLLRQTILRHYPEQKAFNVMDIGAGNFGVLLNLAEQLHQDVSIPSDIKVKLIGLRGEEYTDNPIEERSKSTIYRLGHFCVENLIDELIKHQIFTTDEHIPFDLIFSHYTFKHLVDPVGTFIQAYSLLKPKTGVILSDCWKFALNQESVVSTKSAYWQRQRDNIAWLLAQSGSEFLLSDFADAEGGQFILQRCDESQHSIPLSYTEQLIDAPLSVSSFKHSIVFSPDQKLAKVLKVSDQLKPPNFYGLRGTVQLLKTLQENYLLSSSYHLRQSYQTIELDKRYLSQHSLFKPASTNKGLDEIMDVHKKNPQV